MKLSNKQKRALEKVTGKPWDSWQPEAIEAYFAWSDRGDDSSIRTLLGECWENICMPIWRGGASQTQLDLFDLIVAHKFHASDVKNWIRDFRVGLLFMSDFEGSPQVYKEHALEVYRKAMSEPPP